jgi:predicted ATPase
MLSVMRDPDADQKRREAMAMAAAPYLHSKLSAIEAKLSPAVAEPSPEKRGVAQLRRGLELLAALAPVYDWFTEGFDTRDLKEAKALLDELQT